jgi:hypothetical protein
VSGITLTAPTEIEVPSSVGIKTFAFTVAIPIPCSNITTRLSNHYTSLVIPPY